MPSATVSGTSDAARVAGCARRNGRALVDASRPHCGAVHVPECQAPARKREEACAIGQEGLLACAEEVVGHPGPRRYVLRRICDGGGCEHG
eukprot:scaffold19820_cov69-Phaeocystis_antarctica.AAC.1